MTRTRYDTWGKRERRNGGGGLRGVRRLFSLGLVVLAGAVGATFAPWMTGPDKDLEEIDARWAELEEIAAPQLSGGDPSLLVAAAEAIEASSMRLSFTEGSDEVDTPARLALEHLVDWSRSGGGVGEGACRDKTLTSSGLTELTRLALREAESTDDPKFRAAVQLGLALRDRSGLFGVLSGQSFLHMALEKVAERGWELPEVLYRERPTSAHLRAILARDITCNPAVSGKLFDYAGFEPAHLASGPLEELIASITFDRGREQLYFRAELGERMMTALESKNPVPTYIRLIPPRDEIAPSLVVREYSEYGKTFEMPGRLFARYNAALLDLMEPPPRAAR